MITLITVKRKKQLEWCDQALKIDSGLVKRLRSALNESEAERTGEHESYRCAAKEWNEGDL